MLSFDITDRNIRIIRGAENKNKINISSAATLNIDEDIIVNGHVKDVPRLATIMNQKIKQNRMMDKEAIVSISSNMTIFKELNVRRMQKEAEFTKLIKSEMQAKVGIDDSYAPGYGIRLDSGDLAYLSQEVRRILDEHGLTQCKIFATNGLDEYLITDLERQGARIDSYGVGDAIATSKAAPCFGNVYKLVQIDGQPVLKRSEDKIKLINPGFQITWRISAQDSVKGNRIDGYAFKVDVTCLRGDSMDLAIQHGKTITVRDEYDSYKYKHFEEGTYEARPLQHQVIAAGKRVVPQHTLQQKKIFYKDNLHHFSPGERRLINPHYYKVDISDALYDVKMSIIGKLVKEIEEFEL